MWKEYTKDDKRVRDHCHSIGKHRRSAHEVFNLNFKLTDKILVIFHNLRGYDSDFTMQQIGDVIKKKSYENKQGEGKQMTLNVIPNNMEKYMAIMLGCNPIFIESFQFMSQSLEKLVSNLPKEDLKYTSETFKGEALEVMSQKGVYPYDYMDWTASRSLMTQSCRPRSSSIVSLIMSTLQMMTTSRPKKFGEDLI